MEVAHTRNRHNLDVHVGYIKKQVDKGIRDGEARQLAVKIVSGKHDADGLIRAYGEHYLAPPGRPCATQDDQCEIDRIWDFVVLNIRYVYDPNGIDTFATLKESLTAGGGDCDDLVIAFATLLGSIGFPVIGRVVTLEDAPDEWAHIFAIVGTPKDDPRKWIALDASVVGATPGWFSQQIAKYKDYVLSRP